MTPDSGRSYVIEVERAQFRFDTRRDTRGKIFDAADNPVGLGASADQGFGTLTISHVNAETSGDYAFQATNSAFSEGLYGGTLKTVCPVTGIAGNDWLTVPANNAYVPDAISGGAGRHGI